jgi:serine/threonine-protein kinase
VLDFGIAKAASRATSTEDGQVKGKAAYMAPEQLQHGSVDRRADIFAAGVCLWELLTGRRLFLADSPQGIMAKVLNAPIEAPQRIVADVPPAIGDIALRALERDVEKRFASAEEMALLLEDAVKLPRAKEIGAWVTDVAAQTIAARAELVQIVERSSHRMDAAQQTTGPELQAAIEEAERRRQMTEQPTDVGAAAKPGGSPQTPRSSPNAFVAPAQVTAPYQTPRTGPQPFAPAYPPPDQLTQLSTVNTSHGLSQPPPPSSVSRVSLAVGLMGATALLVALGIGFVVTRPPANAGPARTAEPPPPVSPPVSPPVEPSASLAPGETAPPTPTASASSTKQKPILRGGGGNVGKKPLGCDPPYEFDAKGLKHFKPECL